VPAYKVTRYSITQLEGYLFNSWQLQASNDEETWIVLHSGSESFVGQKFFDFENDTFYEFYRIYILNWLPGQTRGVAKVEFFSRLEDISTTSTTYTTTSTTTTVTTLTTTTVSTTTTTTTTLTTTTTEEIWCEAPLNLSVTGTAESIHISWNNSLHATSYELSVRENDSYEWTFVTSIETTQYVYTGFSNRTTSLQFRVRSRRLGFASAWVYSNVFTIPSPTAQFLVRYLGSESESFLSIEDVPALVEFVDLSTPSSPEAEIVSWQWKFYAHNLAREPYSTSSVQHPLRSFLQPGFFAVSLTVTEDTGRSHTVTKENFLEIGCKLTAEFSAALLDSPPETLFINVSEEDSIRFTDTSTGSNVVGWKWKFYQDFTGNVTSNYVQSSLKTPVLKYNKEGVYTVELEIIGSYGQTASIRKENFVQVVPQIISTTTTETTTTSTTTTLTTSSVSTTSQPPDGWARIGVFGGHAIASSQRFGFESWRVFDKRLESEWRAETDSTTTTSSTTTTTSTTQLPHVQDREIDHLWYPNTDVKNFRDNFLDIFTGQSRYKLLRYVGLPDPYDPVLHRGTFVYDEVTDDFYVGLSTDWQKVNPAQLLHVLSHVSGGSDEFLVVSPYEPYDPFKGQIWIDTSDTESTSTTTVSQSSTTHWSGNLAVPGPWGVGECSSEIVGHECSKAFDVNSETYWQAANETSQSDPEWIQFWWEERKVIKIYRMTVNSDGCMPITWELKASRNGLVWTTIDYRANQVFTGMRTYLITNFTDYNFYRFDIHETLDGLPPCIISLEMFDAPPQTSTTSTTMTTLSTTGSTTQSVEPMWFQGSESVSGFWFLAPVPIADSTMQFFGSITVGDMTHEEFDLIEGPEDTNIFLDSSLTLLGNMTSGDVFIFENEADIFGSSLELQDFTFEE
jgi:PKD repeat protein